MKQTEDNREGMYEGVIACYLAEYIDSEEFWEVIDGRIYADHETVLDFIEFVTEGSGYIYAWLEPDQANDLITACPSLKEHLIRKGFDVIPGQPVQWNTDSKGNKWSVTFED